MLVATKWRLSFGSLFKKNFFFFFCSVFKRHSVATILGHVLRVDSRQSGTFKRSYLPCWSLRPQESEGCSLHVAAHSLCICSFSPHCGPFLSLHSWRAWTGRMAVVLKPHEPRLFPCQRQRCDFPFYRHPFHYPDMEDWCSREGCFFTWK